MKENYHAGRGLLRLLTLLAFLIAGNPQVARAAEPEQGGISKEDIERALRAGQAKMNAHEAPSVVGTWKNPDGNMSMRFSEVGEFQFTREKNGQTTEEKGLYKVTSSGDSLVVSVFFFRGKSYFSVTPLSENRAAWQELNSPEAKPEPAKAVTWVREQPAPQSAETRPPSGNAQGAELFALQKPENLIGKWKSISSDGAVTTISFSDKGEFERVVEVKGRKESVVTAAYKAQTRQGGLLVTLTDGGDKAFYGFALLSKDRCFSQLLKSPDDQIDSNEKGRIMIREKK